MKLPWKCNKNVKKAKTVVGVYILPFKKVFTKIKRNDKMLIIKKRKRREQKMEKETKNAENLMAVTHTHTHTRHLQNCWTVWREQ